MSVSSPLLVKAAAEQRTAHEQFAGLHAATREKLVSLANEWAAGEWSASTFSAEVDAVLLEAHTEAVVIGRQHAGDLVPREADDERFAAEVVTAEHEFLQGFRQDLADGRYTLEDGTRDGEAVAQRAGWYANKLTATANTTMTLTLPEDTLYTWRLGGSDETCSDCVELADASPYTLDELPTVPGAAETLCLFSCKCSIQTDEGLIGFSVPG